MRQVDAWFIQCNMRQLDAYYIETLFKEAFMPAKTIGTYFFILICTFFIVFTLVVGWSNDTKMAINTTLFNYCNAVSRIGIYDDNMKESLARDLSVYGDNYVVQIKVKKMVSNGVYDIYYNDDVLNKPLAKRDTFEILVYANKPSLLQRLISSPMFISSDKSTKNLAIVFHFNFPITKNYEG